MNIGLISDTHGSLPAAVFDVFNDVDQIIHAGDIGDPSVISELETIAPVNAIYGNIDTWPIVSRYPLTQTIEIDSYLFYLVHEVVNIKLFQTDFIIYT